MTSLRLGLYADVKLQSARSMAFIFAVALFAISSVADAQNYQSPCPRLFVYEPRNETDRWYGILTLLSDVDLTGVWLRVMFDRPSLQLGNWFGEVDPREMNKEYLIKRRNYKLKAHTPEPVAFFIKYNPVEPVPQFVGFRLNAVTKCPEKPASALGAPPEPITSGPGTTTAIPPTTRTTEFQFSFSEAPVNAEGQFGNGGSSDDIYPSDFVPGNVISGLGSQQNVECGTLAVQARPLITYGQATQEGEFPWHVALYHTRGASLSYICGGSLVSPRHVITAGHCITRPRSDTTTNPENLLIYLGKYYLKRWSNRGIQDNRVERILLHPQYNPDTFANDIAVLKLANRVEYTNYVRPICLWDGPQDLGLLKEKYGTVVGWGFNEHAMLTEALTKVKMPVIAKETCIYSFPDFFSRYTTTNTYCAGFQNGTSVCNGDSGGGMIFPKDTNVPYKTVWQLRGLVSISVALQNELKCNPNHYVVFTDVAKYTNFIKAAMAA